MSWATVERGCGSSLKPIAEQQPSCCLANTDAMEFTVQKLHPALQPGRRLTLANSNAPAFSFQGCWDGGCALHATAMALARRRLGFRRPDRLQPTFMTKSVSIAEPASDSKIGYAYVVNRVMSGIKNWSTFRGIINDRWQFSDINAPRVGAYGCVQNVPESRVPARVRTMVIAHLQDRANGGPSLVGNNLSYANPYVLDEATDATRAWVEDVVRQASITGYRYGKGRAVHVHGTTQGLMPFRPDPFTIVLPESYNQ